MVSGIRARRVVQRSGGTLESSDMRDTNARGNVHDKPEMKRHRAHSNLRPGVVKDIPTKPRKGGHKASQSRYIRRFWRKEMDSEIDGRGPQRSFHVRSEDSLLL